MLGTAHHNTNVRLHYSVIGPVLNVGAGTDVLGMATTATKSSDGSYYQLNGTKMWITNGTLDGRSTGDVYLVYAKTGDEK